MGITVGCQNYLTCCAFYTIIQSICFAAVGFVKDPDGPVGKRSLEYFCDLQRVISGTIVNNQDLDTALVILVVAFLYCKSNAFLFVKTRNDY